MNTKTISASTIKSWLATIAAMEFCLKTLEEMRCPMLTAMQWHYVHGTRCHAKYLQQSISDAAISDLTVEEEGAQ